MQVVTGGYAQGKLQYVLENAKCLENQDCCDSSCYQEEASGPKQRASKNKVLVINEENYSSFFPEFSIPGETSLVAVNHLHLIIKAVHNRDSVLSWLESIMDSCDKVEAELAVISDELGCGIIPMDRGDRDWREDNGRIMCDLARKADSVTRIVCGIPQKLK